MREITANLTPDLEARYKIKETLLPKAEPFPVKIFSELFQKVAQLSLLNKDYMMLFRGQLVDYKNKGGASTFYPTIYRPQKGKNALFPDEIHQRFSVLHQSGRLLLELLEEFRIKGIEEVQVRELARWSLLQHYQVCGTPLFDLTQSLSVACSFATRANHLEYGYVYVFGLPYPANRITHNSEHDILLVRLLGVSPPSASKPLYQEGYLAGTEEITDTYDSKSVLDFNRRLVAKFRVPTAKSFWDEGFAQHPRKVLDPSDKIEHICEEIKKHTYKPFVVGELKVFFELATEVEKRITLMNTKSGKTISDHIANLDIYGITDKEMEAVRDVFDFRAKAIRSRVPLSTKWVREQNQKARKVLMGLHRLVEKK